VSQELRLEASDLAAAAQLVGRLQQTLVVRSMAVRLSPAARRAAEDALVAEAIAAFHARAEIVRQSMKASAYHVRELTVATAPGPGPRPLMMEQRAMQAAPAPVALEAGQSQITVSASGSIQLERKP
jgi:predicted secreted protein